MDRWSVVQTSTDLERLWRRMEDDGATDLAERLRAIAGDLLGNYGDLLAEEDESWLEPYCERLNRAR